MTIRMFLSLIMKKVILLLVTQAVALHVCMGCKFDIVHLRFLYTVWSLQVTCKLKGSMLKQVACLYFSPWKIEIYL